MGKTTTKSAKASPTAKKTAGAKKPVHVLVTDHLKRMSAGPMPDVFGTQLSTYLERRPAKRSTPAVARRKASRERP